MAETFGMRVIFYNTSETVALGNARRMYSMNQVLEASDIVSVHVSGKVSNEGLIGEEEFMNMKDGALFINASRGKVVDLEALARQHVAGTWLTKIRIGDGGASVGLEGKTFSSELVPVYIQQLANEKTLAGTAFNVMELHRSEGVEDQLNFKISTN